MFKWDGTDITDLISHSNITCSCKKFNKIEYWIIRYYPDINNDEPKLVKECEEICMIRSCKNGISCLIDELKPIFGLRKLGTHWCKYGPKNKTKILIKANIINNNHNNSNNHNNNEDKTIMGNYMIPSGYIPVGYVPVGVQSEIKSEVKSEVIQLNNIPEGYVKEDLSTVGEDITLNNLPASEITDLLTLQVQEIFTFRELLGVTISFESSIIVRENSRKELYPISFYDPNMATFDTKIIPYTILDKWFKDTSIDEVVKRLLKIYDINKLGVTLHNLRTQIENTINRVDRNLISYKEYILTRITQRLQTTL